MNRNRNTLAALAGALVAAFSAVGCGGTDRIETGEDKGLESFSLEAAKTQRVYQGVATRVTVPAGIPARFIFGLRQGVPTDVLVADKEAEPLKLKVLRRRSDGTTELVQPVTSLSGFAIVRVTARAEGDLALALPAGAKERSLVVWMECPPDVPGGRCSSKLQPGEVCYAGVTCDDGLACANADGAPAASLEYGTCTASLTP